MSDFQYVGDPEGYRMKLQRSINVSLSEKTFQQFYSTLVQLYWSKMIKFGVGFSKTVGFPLGLLLQILTVIFLVRGNTGFSKSAKKWFLVIVCADIAGTLYRTYELLTDDFFTAHPTTSKGPGIDLMYLMWGPRRREDAFLQDVMCRVFFIILYFPLYLSPIALTISSMIRCYCVKYPLEAKAKLTWRLDTGLIMLASLLSLAVSVVLGALVIRGTSFFVLTSVNGIQMFLGWCTVPSYLNYNSDKGLQSIGFIFMLVVNFLICLFNMLAATIIITVLFQSKRSRFLMSTGVADDKMEARATARLLGMNVTLLICFFFSRLLLVTTTRIDNVADPILYSVFDRVAAFLVHIPYFTNSLFIAGVSRSFFEFYLPCILSSKPRLSETNSQNTF